jgi:hypothetical protein
MGGVQNGVGEERPVEALGHGVFQGLLGHAPFGVLIDAQGGVSGKAEPAVEGRAVGRRPDIDARLAHALQGLQVDHQPRPLRGIGLPRGPSAQAEGIEHRLLGRPLPGERGDGPRRNPADRFGPFGSPGGSAPLSKDVALPLLEAERARADVIVIVGVLGQPDIGDRLGQGRVRARPGGDPLVAVDTAREIIMGIDEDLLDPGLLEPDAPDRRFLPGIQAARRVGIRAPVDDELRMFQSVFEQVVLLGHAEPPEKPVGVRRAPVPPLPAVGVVIDQGEAQQMHEPEIDAEMIAQIAPVVMRRARPGDRGLAVSLLDPLDFG